MGSSYLGMNYRLLIIEVGGCWAGVRAVSISQPRDVSKGAGSLVVAIGVSVNNASGLTSAFGRLSAAHADVVAMRGRTPLFMVLQASSKIRGSPTFIYKRLFVVARKVRSSLECVSIGCMTD